MKLNKKQVLIIVILGFFMTLFFSGGNFISGLIRACISIELALTGIYFIERNKV